MRRTSCVRTLISCGVATLCLGLTIVASPAVEAVALTPPTTQAAPNSDGWLADAEEANSQDMALRLAQRYGHEVEVLSARSETSTTHALADGTLRLDSSAEPIRVHNPDGSWSLIDTNLVLRPDGVVAARSTPVPVEFGGGGSNALARIQADDGTWLGVTWKQGDLPAPRLDGDSAAYEDVLPGVDLRMTAGVEGFSEVLVVHSAEAAANPALSSVGFGVNDGALTTTTGESASLVSESSDGSVQLRQQAPTWWDSSTGAGADGPGDNGVARPLPDATATPSSVTIDAASVATRDDVQYPVYVDPSWTGKRQAYMYVDKAYPNENYLNGSGASDKYVHVGYVDGANSDDGKAHTTRGYFRMDVSGVRGAVVLSAQFNVKLKYSFSCNDDSGAAGVEAHLTSSNNGFGTGTDWNHQPGIGGQLGSTVKAAYRSGCTNGSGYKPIGFDATDGVKYAVGIGDPSAHIVLQAADEGNNLSWKKFDNAPTLSVTYDRRPTVASGLSIRPCYTQCTGNVISRPTASSPLKATARATDPDGGNLRYFYQFFASQSSAAPGPVRWQGYTPYLASGTTYALTPPASSVPIANGGRWMYRVQAVDPNGYSGGYSAFQMFTFDLSAPPAPNASVSGATTDPDVDEINRVGVVGAPVSMSFATANNAGVVEVVYALGPELPTYSSPPACNSGSGGVFVVCNSGSTWPTQTIAARNENDSVQLVAFDAAGNRSSTAEVDLYVKPNLAAVNAGHSWQVDPSISPTVADSATANGSPFTETSAVDRHLDQPNPNVVADGEIEPTSVTVQDFDGAASPMTFARTSSSVVNGSRSFTIGAWVKTGPSVTGTAMDPFSLRGTNTSVAIAQLSAAGRFGFGMAAQDVAASPNWASNIFDDEQMAPDTWYFVVVSWDAVNKLMSLSIDNATPKTLYRPTPGLASPGYFELGMAETPARQPWTGSVFNPFVVQGLVTSRELRELAGTAELGYPTPAAIDN